MYGYTPRPAIDVSFDSHTLDSRKDFLSDMLEARKLVEENLRMARDINVFYVPCHKVKWKDRLEEDGTWETEETLRKHFPTFPLQECTIKWRGGVCNVHLFRRTYLGPIIL